MSNDTKKLPDHLILDLPDWSTAKPSEPLRLAEIIALCEKMLPIWNVERFKNPPRPMTRAFSLVEQEEELDTPRSK